MIENAIYYFLRNWIMGLIALILGRYVGKQKVSFYDNAGKNILLYLQVWIFTTLAKLAFGYIGYIGQWSENNQASFANFLLPIIAGAFFARQLFLYRSK